MVDNNNDSNFFDLNNDDTSQSLDDIIAEDNNAQKKEDEIINKDRRKSTTKKAAVVGGSVLAVCLIAGGLMFVNPFGGDQNVGEDDKKMTAIDNKDKTVPVSDNDVVDEDEFYKEDGKYFPVKVEKWQEKAFVDQDKTDVKKSIIKKEASQSLGVDANILPSESSGYTSNTNKEYDKDGNINPDFSYWTYEVFTSQAGEHIEKLLNPTFGDWGRIQYSSYPGNKDLEFDKFEDMFTSNWIDSHKNDKYSDYMPIFADWEGNDYGLEDQLLSSGPRWYGEVENSSSDFKFNEKTQQYVVEYEADVKFTAWTQDQSKLEKKGKLKLTFVSNEDDNKKNPTSDYRVLIDKASLKVDG